MKESKGVAVQKILSYLIIVTAILSFVFALYFMSNFYRLFLDGNSETYQFFKDLQMLNNAIFNASLIFVVLAILLVPFDLNKKRAGFFGVLFTAVFAFINIMNSMTVFDANSYFAAIYYHMDFSSLDGYTPSLLPFNIANVMFIVTVVLSGLIFIISTLNFIVGKKKKVKK